MEKKKKRYSEELKYRKLTHCESKIKRVEIRRESNLKVPDGK